MTLWEELAKTGDLQRPPWVLEYFNQNPACEYVYRNHPEIKISSNSDGSPCAVVCPLKSIWRHPVGSFFSKGCMGNRKQSPFYRFMKGKNRSARRQAAQAIIVGVKKLLRDKHHKNEEVTSWESLLEGISVKGTKL